MARTFELYASGFKGGVPWGGAGGAPGGSGRAAASGSAAGPTPAPGGTGAAAGPGGSDAVAPRRDVNISTAIRPTPTQIAMSATLNVGQWSVTAQPFCTLPMARFIDSIHLAW